MAENLDPEDGLRSRVLSLHGMLHTVLNESPLLVVPPSADLSDCLADILDELDDVEAVLATLRRCIRELDQLAARDE